MTIRLAISGFGRIGPLRSPRPLRRKALGMMCRLLRSTLSVTSKPTRTCCAATRPTAVSLPKVESSTVRTSRSTATRSKMFSHP